MPAAKLTSRASVVCPYDVLARSDGTTGLMLHALLCNEADVRDDVTDKTVLRAFHMGPPLGPRRDSCDAFGTANLTAQQKTKIKSFIDERREECAAEKKRQSEMGSRWDARSQYRIHPAATPPTPGYSLWRFNCVGFVLQAYLRARIKLVTGPYPLKTGTTLNGSTPMRRFIWMTPINERRWDLRAATDGRWFWSVICCTQCREASNESTVLAPSPTARGKATNTFFP